MGRPGVFAFDMHRSNLQQKLMYLLTREDGVDTSELMWSLALVVTIVGVALVLGPQIGADWREFVGRPLPR